MERRVAIHLLDKLAEMGIIKQTQINQTVVTFVQEQTQVCLRDNKMQIVSNDFVERHKSDSCNAV